MKKNLRIATVYISRPIDEFRAVTMDTVRWLKISEALANRGYQVDMITNEKANRIIKMGANLRRVPVAKFHWQDYDIIKTLFQEGFASLEKAGASNHPFIISKTTVVGLKNEPGVYVNFLTRLRDYQIQKRMAEKCRYITVLSKENKNLWEKLFGKKNNILLVPTGVDEKISPRNKNPYAQFNEKIVLFAGNIYRTQMRRINFRWQKRLNNLGKLLQKQNMRLFFIGSGMTDWLNPRYVTYLGAIEHQKFWDYQYFADCGLVLAHGEKQNFESSKIYYYLRTGLPVVSESPVPNNYLIKETKLGMIIPFDNNAKMADAIEKVVNKKWDKNYAIKYMVKNHTWDKRVEIYDQIIKKEFFQKNSR